MASMDTPKKGVAFTFGIALQSVATGTIFKTTPTLAAGDILTARDAGNFANITTLPTQIQSTGVLPIALTAAEMNGDIIYVLFHDAAGAEWGDQLAVLNTTPATLADLSTTLGAAGAGLTALGDTRLAYLTGAVALEATLTAIKGAGWTTETLKAIYALVGTRAVPGDAMTFTMTPATIASMISGTTMTIDTHNYFSIGLTVGSIATRTKAWLAIKNAKTDADSASVLFVEETAGCTVVNGAVYATITDASLTVTNATTGATTFAIKAAVTSVLTPGAQHFWEYKVLEAAGPRTVAEGICLVEAGVIKAIA